MSAAPDVLLTIKEYAALVGKHPDTVRRSIRRGTFRWPIERSGCSETTNFVQSFFRSRVDARSVAPATVCRCPHGTRFSLVLVAFAAHIAVQGDVSAQAPGADALVAAYGFNEGTGTTATDASGNLLTGAITGATWSATGQYGAALSFDGSGDWVTINDASSLDLSTGMTIQAWVFPTALSGWRTVVLKETLGGLAYALYAHDNAPRPATYVTVGGGDVPAIGSSQLPLNTWTHLAATYNGATLRLYVNGSLAGSTAVSGAIVGSSNACASGGTASGVNTSRVGSTKSGSTTAISRSPKYRHAVRRRSGGQSLQVS